MVEYIRKLSKSYMLVPMEKELEPWETAMVENLRGKAFLKGVGANDSGERKIWYEISGLTDLDTYMEIAAVDYNFLCLFYMAVYEACRQVEEYLLEEDNICLNRDMVFFDRENDCVKFCLFPRENVSLQKELKELTEEILGKLDHSDERACNLAYGVYESLCHNSFYVEKLKEMVCLEYEKEELRPNYQEQEKIEKTKENKKENKKEYKNEDENKEKNGSEFEKLREKFLEILGIEYKNTKTEINGSSVKVDRKTFRRNTRKNFEKYQERQIYVEPEWQDEPEEKITSPTVLLFDRKQTPQGMLYYEGGGKQENISISKQIFLVGSDESCDGVINSRAVSRNHARFVQSEGCYFLEDLNSKNGTRIGDRELAFKTREKLEKNDVVYFADERFRFV